MERSDWLQLSKDELIEMVLRLQRPAKDSRTSSKPPSTDKKEKRLNSRPGGAKPGHEPHNQELADFADMFRDHEPTACKRCGHSFSGDDTMALTGVHDEIDIPAIRPHVTRHRRFFVIACNAARRQKPPHLPWQPQRRSGRAFTRWRSASRGCMHCLANA